MYKLLLWADTSGTGQIEEIARNFGVDWPQLMSQIISFCIVCALLWRFAYRPVLAMLDERRRLIAEGLANAEKIKADLARTDAHRQEVLAQINAQATKLFEKAHAEAARVQQEETEKAVAAAEQIVVKAREAAERDHARMLADLKREVGRLVVETTAAVAGKILTPEDQHRLDEETARQLAG